MPRTSTLLPLAAFALVLTSCSGESRAWGENNSIIVGTSEDQWLGIGGMVESALETRIVTVRPEKTFRVTHQDPARPEWDRLRRFRQLLLIGTADDPWMAEALDLAEQASFEPPEIFQVEDVWARGQTATVMLLASRDPAEADPLMEPLHDLMDGQYREWVKARMFMTGANEELADSLWELAQFSLVLPQLYRRRTEDSVYMFRNDNPDPSRADPADHDHLADTRTPGPQPGRAPGLAPGGGRRALQLPAGPGPTAGARQASPTGRRGSWTRFGAVWSNPPEDAFPAGGPLITRLVPCPHQGRDYLVDAWLYAPGRDKYQYVLQLETILDSFRCRAASRLASV